jgi:TfoX/Sxy family transcriptional regulator of competence genes
MVSSWVLVTLACNHCYLGGRDQEDPGFEASPGKQSIRPYLEKKITKKDWLSGSSGKSACLASVRPSSNPSAAKKKKKQKPKIKATPPRKK